MKIALALVVAGVALAACAYLVNENATLRQSVMGLEKTLAKTAEAVAMCEGSAKLTTENAARCRIAVRAAGNWLVPAAPGQPRLTDSDTLQMIRRDFTKPATACLEGPNTGNGALRR